MAKHDDLVDVRGTSGQVLKYATTQQSSTWLVLLGQRRGKSGEMTSL